MTVVLPEKMKRIRSVHFREMPNTKDPHSAQILRVSIIRLTGNTTIKLQLQVDLAINRVIKLHARSRETVNVLVCVIG